MILGNLTPGAPGVPCSTEADRLHYGPRDLRSTTWYLNRTRFRTWDHFPVVVKVEGKELKVKKEKKGLAGWIPESEDERQKFQ